MTATENGHAPLTEQQVRAAIAGVQEPELGRGLVELNMVPLVGIRDRDVHLTVELASPIAPYRPRLDQELRDALATLPDLGTVSIEWTTRVRASSGGRTDAQPIKGVKNTIAVASGKGGVGKSTVAVNLAVALAKAGAKVGLLDADVYGPSIPLMMGRHDKPLMREGKIVPLEAHGVHLMSIGFILDPNKALIWRGPLVAQLITQFLNDVDWGELDYLVIDLPPGTGDVQLTLVQKIPISGAIIVATPQDVALADAVKGLKMFEEVKTPILGIVENMSGFVCPDCGSTHYIFRQGGAKRTAEANRVPFLGEIPLEPAVVQGGDEGTPIVAAAPDSNTAKAFAHIAERAAGELAKQAVQKPRKPVLMLKPMARS